MKETSKETEKELQILNTEAQFIGEQIERVDASLMEMEYVKNCLDELASTSNNSQILAPVSNGIFLKAKLEKTDMLLVNVGKEIVVEKTIPDTKSLLDSRIKEMSEMRENMLDQMQKIEDRLVELGDHIH